MTFEECNLEKKKIKKLDKWFDKEHNGLPIRHWLNINQNIAWNSAWAAHLAKRLNVEFENRAKGGTSIDEHYYNIVRDLHLNKIKDDDLVVVGLTSVERLFLFDNGSPKTKMFGLDFQWKDLNFRNKLVTEIFNDQLLLWNYCKTLLLFKSLESKIHIRLQFMRPSFHFLDTQFNKNTKGVDFFISDTYKQIEHMLFLKNKFLIIKDESETCGFGHPSEICHIRFAEEIYLNSNLNA
jgi:hypothetical protein